MFFIYRQSALVVFACLWATAAMGQATRPAIQAVRPAGLASRPATQTAPADSVAVTVNGRAIMESDVNEMFQTHMARRMGGRQMPQAQMKLMLESARPRVLDFLITSRLLDEQVEQAKINVTDEELTEQVERRLRQHLMLQGITREAFATQVKAGSGMSLEKLLAGQVANPAFKQFVLHRKLIEKKFPDKMEVTEEEIKDRYEASLAKQVKASHILIDTRQLKTDEAKNKAREKIDQILIEVKKPGSDFAALAREHSDGPSKSKGGELDPFPRKGVMAEPFAAAAFALEPGEISDVVETQFGYHIIKVTEVKTTSLEDVRESIVEKLKAQKIQPALMQYASELKQSATIAYPPGKEPKPASRPAGRLRTRPATSPAATTRPAGAK